MILAIIKWLSWACALGFLLLVVAGTPLVTGQFIGFSELIVTGFVVGLMSAPGWIIHFTQRRRQRSQ